MATRPSLLSTLPPRLVRLFDALERAAEAAERLGLITQLDTISPTEQSCPCDAARPVQSATEGNRP